MSSTPQVTPPTGASPAATTVTPSVHAAPTDSGGALAAVGSVLGIVLFPLIMVGKLFVFRVSERQGNQVALFTSFSSLIYTWPIVFVGFLCAALSAWHVGTPAGLGWVWLITVILVLLVLGTDINRTVAFVWMLVVSLIFTGGWLVKDKLHIPVLSWVYDWFASLNVQFESGTAVAISTVLGVILVVTFLQASFDGRHEISSREVTHRRLLRASESLPLTVNRVRLDWPDLLEMMTLFGAGHLVVIDNMGKEVMRIPNIPFLWFFRDEVNRILDIMATTEVAPQMLDARP